MRGALPPTPPMQSDSGFDGRQSPAGSTSGYSVASAPGYYFGPTQVPAINNVEPHTQRQHVPALQRRVSMPATAMAYAQSPYNGSQYAVSPQQSMSSYYSSPMQPTPPQSQISGLYYQRPLPQVCYPALGDISEPKTNKKKAIPTTFNAGLSYADTIIWRKPMATSSLHLTIFCSLFPPISRSVYLPNLQQSILETF
jgi:hypothetical protein